MNSDVVSFEALAPAYPELLLAVGTVVLLLVAVLLRRERHDLILTLSVILLAVVGFLTFSAPTGILFNGGFIADEFARYMKLLVIGGSALALVLSFSNARQNGLDKFEYSILVLLATLGMMAMVSANDLRAFMSASSCSRSPFTWSQPCGATTPRRLRRGSSTSCSAHSRPACCSTGPHSSTASPAPRSSTKSSA